MLTPPPHPPSCPCINQKWKNTQKLCRAKCKPILQPSRFHLRTHKHTHRHTLKWSLANSKKKPKTSSTNKTEGSLAVDYRAQLFCLLHEISAPHKVQTLMYLPMNMSPAANGNPLAVSELRGMERTIEKVSVCFVSPETSFSREQDRIHLQK